MAVVTGWSKDGASISEISVGVGETVTVNANLGREFEYFRDTMSTADTSVATASWAGSGSEWTAVVTITGVSAGTTETALIGGYDTQDSPLTITVLSAEDESYLNKRGLAHFWENVDGIKQNKLTAGAGISITNDVISATGGGTADAVDWGHITGSMSNQTDLTTALNAKANTADLAAVATSGSYNDLSNKPTIPGGTITGVSVNNTSIATSGVANIPLVSRNLDGAVPRTNAVGGAYDGYVFGIDADTAKWMKLNYNSLSNKPTKVSDFTNDAGYITSYTDTQVTQTRVDPSAITTFYPVASVSRTTNTGDVKKFSAVKINYVNDDGGRAELELGQNSYNDPVYGELTLWDIGPSSQHKTTLLRATDATNQTFYFPYNADSTSGTLVANGSRTTATGSATNPVYADSDGILHPTTYALNATVPSNAVFTDTTYSDATTSAAGLMSASDKTKLNGIATGAEVNVQSDWNVTSTSSDAFIKNKPTIPTAGTITSGSTGYATGGDVYNAIGDVESILTTLNNGGGAQ